MIRPWDTLAADYERSCDVVVVGSGAGGAAAASTLAEAGLSVVVLEEGGTFTPGEFKPSPTEAFRRLYAQRGNRIMLGSSVIPLPAGRGVGGGTLVNSAICFRAAHRIFARWTEEFGLDGLDDAAVDAYYREVETTLEVAATTPEIGKRHNEVFARGAHRLGLAGGWMPRNAPGCAGCGICELGCPTGGKNSSDRTFLPRALNRGADVLTGCKVQRLLGNGRQIAGVSGVIHDPISREVRGRFTVHAARVVLAAGSIATPLILQAHGLGGAHVGHHLAVHPGSWVGGIFDEVINYWSGVPQGYYAELEPGAGVILETFTAAPSYGISQFPGVGAEFAAWLPRLKHMAFCGAMVEDSESAGTVQAGTSGAPAIRYRMAPADVQKLKRGMAEIARVYEAAGAKELIVGLNPARTAAAAELARDLLARRRKPAEFALYASHPMGTCRMGPDRRKAVVDNRGQVHGARGLYVADASLFPTPLGVNPQMTIMLMALHVAQRIAAEPI